MHTHTKQIEAQPTIAIRTRIEAQTTTVTTSTTRETKRNASLNTARNMNN